MKQRSYILLALAMAGALSACGTSHLSRLDSAGLSGDPVWPTVDSREQFQEGTFPSNAALVSMAPGMTKFQVQTALGHPHFKEGLFGVREWDYVFNFRTPEGQVQCQYKVVYDRDYRVAQTLWRDPCCDQFSKAP